MPAHPEPVPSEQERLTDGCVCEQDCPFGFMFVVGGCLSILVVLLFIPSVFPKASVLL